MDAFHCLLTPAQQLQLSCRVAGHRRAKLLEIWPGLRAVGAGYRLRRGLDGCERIVHDEPCVHLLVERKWPATGLQGRPLPRHLRAAITLNGRRIWCAVPTDVQEMPAAQEAICARNGKDTWPFGIRVGDGIPMCGVATCCIRRPRDPSVTYLLSCRHVLGRTAMDADRNRSGLQVDLGSTPYQTVGRTTSIRGRLADAAQASFDAQLAEIEPQGVDDVMHGISFESAESYLRNPWDVGLGYWIATGRADGSYRHLVWTDHVGVVTGFDIPYALGDGSQVVARHDLLLRGRPGEPLEFGDSGSPATTATSGHRLMGMFIASSERFAYVIPAWQLLSPLNYGRLGETRWELVP